MEEIRLNKWLSELGICSRREADRLIEAGKVKVDGKAAVTGQKVRENQKISCEGKVVWEPEEGKATGESEEGKAVGESEEGKAAGKPKEGKAAEEPKEGKSADGLEFVRTGGRQAENQGRRQTENRTEEGIFGTKKHLNSGKRPRPIWLVVNKPKGIVCTTSPKDRAKTIVELVNYPLRVYPVGRLDKDSRGLILMTNQGDLVNKIMRGGNAHEKEYEDLVDKPLTEDFLKAMAEGVELKELNQKTRPCKIWRKGKNKFGLILTQGLNRQIRRMCETLGYHVLDLKRIRIMNICLGGLEEGKFREVTGEEYENMVRLLEESGAGNLPCACRNKDGNR